jgi:hypothetical protein
MRIVFRATFQCLTRNCTRSLTKCFAGYGTFEGYLVNGTPMQRVLKILTSDNPTVNKQSKCAHSPCDSLLLEIEVEQTVVETKNGEKGGKSRSAN